MNTKYLCTHTLTNTSYTHSRARAHTQTLATHIHIHVCTHTLQLLDSINLSVVVYFYDVWSQFHFLWSPFLWNPLLDLCYKGQFCLSRISRLVYSTPCLTDIVTQRALKNCLNNNCFQILCVPMI